MLQLLFFFFLICNLVFEFFLLFFECFVFLSKFLMSFFIRLLLFFLVNFISLFLFPFSSIIVSCIDKFLHILLTLLHFFNLLFFVILKISSLSFFDQSLMRTRNIYLKSLINLGWFLRKITWLLFLGRIRRNRLNFDKSIWWFCLICLYWSIHRSIDCRIIWNINCSIL